MFELPYTLYQFPISHYCEKVRWALDYKGLEYRPKNLLPGIHMLTTKRLCAQTSVPILAGNGLLVQGSGDIISYLDEAYPDRPLTPQDEEQKEQAMEWERWADKEIGLHLRRYCYHTMLDAPSLVLPMFLSNGPWWGKLYFGLMFTQVRKVMRRMMNITPDTALSSKQRLQVAIDRLYAQYSEREFLVGEGFTRADLTAAALLAPLCRPEKYGLDWPPRLTDEVEAFIQQNAGKLAWVDAFYVRQR